MTFWDRFYQLCEAHNTKPNPVAKELGISSGVVTRWKNVGEPPSGKILIQLANYFDCSVVIFWAVLTTLDKPLRLR